MYALYLFQVLSTVHKTRVNWVLFVRKVAPWYNSLLMKFGNGMLYCLAIMLEAPIKKISECLGVTLRIDSYWWKPNTQSASCCWGGYSQLWYYACIHLLTWPHIQHGGLHSVPGGDSIGLDWEGDVLCHVSRWN